MASRATSRRYESAPVLARVAEPDPPGAAPPAAVVGVTPVGVAGACAAAVGGLVPATPGGILARIGEDGEPDIVSPVPMMRDVVTDALERHGPAGGPQLTQH